MSFANGAPHDHPSVTMWCITTTSTCSPARTASSRARTGLCVVR